MRKHEEHRLEQPDAGSASPRVEIHTVETLAENGALHSSDFAWARTEKAWLLIGTWMPEAVLSKNRTESETILRRLCPYLRG